MELWEILVPTVTNTGKPIRTRYHKVWDEKVRKISGGLTIMQPAKGNWINKENHLFIERMIPVRISCTRGDVDKIIDMTMEYYSQEAIMAYKISNEVIIKHKDDKR